MQAMNGSAGFRSHGRLIGCCLALVLALSGLAFSSVASAAKTPPPVETYLALGDSLAFGYTAQKFNENYPNEAPEYFETGYPNVVAKDLKKEHKGIVLVNDGCPGELSAGLIGEKESIGGKKDAEHKPCAYHFTNGLPLHNSLATLSQLEDAVSILTAENPYTKTKPAHPVVAISINIGSNDELAAVAKCEKEVGEEYAKEGKSKYGATPEEAVNACLVATALPPGGTFEKILNNVKTSTEVIDSTGYTNPIVILGFYNPQSFILPGSDGLQQILNNNFEQAIAKAEFPANVKYANPFPKFNPAPEQGPKEKKAIEKYTEECNPLVQKVTTGHDPGCEGDIHPTEAGAKLLGKYVFEAL
jgi:lysophospholipase L1-like esterase